MKKLEQFFGKRVLGKGVLRFMECLSARSSTERGKDGRSRLFSRLNGMFSPAGVHNRDARPGRSYIFSAAPKLFGHTLPLRIGGAPTRALSPRRWGKQHGRTLLEMLGVLAIIGVLSITALVGFTYAMNKHRANETIYDVMLRGTNVPMIDENYASKPSGYEFRFPDLPAGTYYPMTTKKDGGSSYYVEATGVTYRVCEQILKMEPTDIDQIVVNNSVYQGDSDICGDSDGLAMRFCFGSDGTICNGTGTGGGTSSGDTGSGDTGSGGDSSSGVDPLDPCEGIVCQHDGACINGFCQCVNGYTGTYCEIEPDKCKDIVCEGCQKCDSLDGTCKDDNNQCSNGQTCLDGICICSDNTQCPEGEICQDSSCVKPECMTDDDCEGTQVCDLTTFTCSSCQKGYFLTTSGRCELCSTGGSGGYSTSEEECNKCPDRFFDGGTCWSCFGNLHPATTKENCYNCSESIYANGSCYTCSNSTTLVVAEEDCLRCSNHFWEPVTGQCYIAGCSNGSLQNGRCVCNEGYYLTTSGRCELCSTGGSGGYSTSEEECNKCPDRFFDGRTCWSCSGNLHPSTTKENCYHCPESIYANGSCYTCSTSTTLVVAEEDCLRCSNHFWEPVKGKCYLAGCANGSLQNGRCVCNEGYFLEYNNGKCISCAGLTPRGGYSASEEECNKCGSLSVYKNGACWGA